VVGFISAFASRSGMVPGQHKVRDKTNKLKAILYFRIELSIKENIVMIDAMVQKAPSPGHSP
jgi:hypothetical protein